MFLTAPLHIDSKNMLRDLVPGNIHYNILVIYITNLVLSFNITLSTVSSCLVIFFFLIRS